MSTLQRLGTTAVLLLAFNAQSADLLDKLKDVAKETVPPTSTTSNSTSETLDPASDLLCDSLDSSYTLTENVSALAANSLKCKLLDCSGDEVIPKDPAQLDTWLRNYSKKHLWLPTPIEQSVGASYLSEQKANGLILERDLPNTRKLYEKVDDALTQVKTTYPNLPYALTVYVVDISDRINAQAVPGGHILVTRAAAKDLDPPALSLVMGHEVAHLAKRHMSKQLQQRLVETDQAITLFQSAAVGNVSQDPAVGKQLADRLQCSFANYEVNQETQADACAARAMVSIGGDPKAAWQQYTLARGTVVTDRPDPQSGTNACYTSSATHPEDKDREAHLDAAAAHHRK